MKLDAAIINGPRGPFAVLREGAGQPRLSEDDRRRVKACFQDKHGTLPVVFLPANSERLDLIPDPALASEAEACLNGVDLGDSDWQPFEYAA